MFLATTARTDFWDTSSPPILFLGEWCLRRDRLEDWQHLERRVLPCPWDDRDAFHRAAESLDQYGERLLPLLTDFLNSLHGVRYDVRYWRILVGTWLLHALHVYYDRWICVRDALELHPDLRTFVLDPADRVHALSSDRLVRLSLTDEFNLQLYSEVFESFGCNFESRRLPRGNELRAPISWRSRMRALSAKLMTTAGVAAVRILPNGVVLNQASYLTRTDFARLFLASGFRVWPFEPSDTAAEWSKTPDARRKALADLPARDDFERFFVQRLAEMLPAMVVEEYESRRRRARSLPASSVLATFGGWYANESFCFTAAESQSRGSRLAAIQHGGGYGMLKSAPSERHERRVSDRFLAWGWADDQQQSGVTNVPAATLAPFHRIRRDPAGLNEILFVATAHPRYLYRFHSTPVASQWERYYEWQARFLEALPVELRPRVRFRGNPFFSGMGQGERERLTTRFPWLQWDGSPSLRDSLRRARLVIADHHGTSFLQVLAANVPLVLFWDSDLWELQPEAEAPFDRLRRGGVLHADPESAAAAVATVYPQAEKWWVSAPVVSARTEFTNRFALYRNGWPRDWARALRNVSRRPSESTVVYEAAAR